MGTNIVAESYGKALFGGVLREVRWLAGALNIVDSVRDQAYQLFKSAQNEDLLRGRSIEAIALLADSATKNIALDHYKEFAQYLREEPEGDEWRLPTSDISADTWSRDVNVADERPSPVDVDITAVDFDEMTFAVERALCDKHDISIHQSVDDRREELNDARETVQSGTQDSKESLDQTGGFEFPAASQ